MGAPFLGPVRKTRRSPGCGVNDAGSCGGADAGSSACAGEINQGAKANAAFSTARRRHNGAIDWSSIAFVPIPVDVRLLRLRHSQIGVGGREFSILGRFSMAANRRRSVSGMLILRGTTTRNPGAVDDLARRELIPIHGKISREFFLF